jgi:hypothetical protein
MIRLASQPMMPPMIRVTMMFMISSKSWHWPNSAVATPHHTPRRSSSLLTVVYVEPWLASAVSPDRLGRARPGHNPTPTDAPRAPLDEFSIVASQRPRRRSGAAAQTRGHRR